MTDQVRGGTPAGEHETLERVAQWFSTAKPGFDNKLTIYSARSLQPYFQGTAALEVGAADGQMTEYLLQSFPRLVVVEGSVTYCETLRERFGSELEVHNVLIEAFEPAEQFDTILLAHILEHVEDPIAIIARVSQWLAPGGRVLIAVPNANSFHRLLGVKMGFLSRPDTFSERDSMLGHRRVYSLDRLVADIEQAGLEVETTGGIFFKPLSNRQIEEWFSEEMMEGFYELGKDFPQHAAEIYAVCRLVQT